MPALEEIDIDHLEELRRANILADNKEKFREELNKFAILCKEKSELESKLRQIKQEIAGMETGLLDKMVTAGILSVKTRFGTVYINERIWARYADKAAAVAQLKKMGLTDMVSETFNHISLSSYVSELYKEGKDVGEIFDGCIEANPTYQLLRRAK